jgi:hypothetical protein
VAFSDFDVENMHEDDWKWSLYLAKTLSGRVRLSMQAASDHYRPWEDAPSGAATRYESAFTTLKDWYLMSKIGFTF